MTKRSVDQALIEYRAYGESGKPFKIAEDSIAYRVNFSDFSETRFVKDRSGRAVKLLVSEHGATVLSAFYAAQIDAPKVAHVHKIVRHILPHGVPSHRVVLGVASGQRMDWRDFISQEQSHQLLSESEGREISHEDDGDFLRALEVLQAKYESDELSGGANDDHQLEFDPSVKLRTWDPSRRSKNLG